MADEIVAREKSGGYPLTYRVAKDLEAPIANEPWHLEVQYGSGTSWESAMQGHYKSKNEALLNFARRHSGFTETLKDIETDNIYIKKGIDALFKEKEDREAKQKADDQKREADYRANLGRTNKLAEQFAGVRFKQEKTKIASPEGSLPDQEGLSLGGLTITDNGANGKWKRYNITHQQSGLLVADEFVSQKDAKIAVWRLAQIMDWNRPQDAVMKDIPKGLKLFTKQMREDPYIEYPDDLKDALKKGGKLLGEWTAPSPATSPVSLQWDDLHKQSREELLTGASIQLKFADKKWSELDPMVQSSLTDSLERRSKGKAEISIGGTRLSTHKRRNPMTSVITPKVPAVPEKVTAKEPWMMTRAEWISEDRGNPELHKLLVAEHLKIQTPRTRKVVPPEVLADYPDLAKQAEKVAPAAKEVTASTRLNEITQRMTEIQAIHDSRSLRSRESDERLPNADTIEPDDPRVERWVQNQGRLDVSGIDTPRKHKGKRVARKVRRSTGAMIQVRRIGR